jgi:hypothetical protein
MATPVPPVGGRRSGREQGQVTAEVALLTPFLAMLVMLVVQVGLVVRDQVLVLHAAREAGRVAAVDADLGRTVDAARAATALDPARLEVERSHRGRPGEAVTVTVTYRSPTRLPLVGGLVDDVTLSAAATFRIEQ